MKDLLKLEKCPISGLQIRRKPEWKLEMDDGSYSVEIAKIGTNILYIFVDGSPSVENNIWFAEAINKIIDKSFMSKYFSLIFDYSCLESVSFQAKKTFVQWANSNIHEVQDLIFFGMSNRIKLTISTIKKISSKFNNVHILNSYTEAIHAIIKDESKHLNSEPAENARINELIGYLGKMTWTGDLNQKIPILPDDDPLAGLFAAIYQNQEDLREIDNERKETHKELTKLISEKDRALKLVSESEMAMLGLLNDVKAKELETKKANEQFETIIKGANLGWWD